MTARTMQPPAWIRPYVGLFWREGGRVRPHVDCYGLVRLVIHDRLKVELPAYSAEQAAAEPGPPRALAMARRLELDTITVEAGKESVCDLVLLKAWVLAPDGQRHFVAGHLGIVVADGILLHCPRREHSRWDHYRDNPNLAKRVVSFHRLQGVPELGT